MKKLLLLIALVFALGAALPARAAQTVCVTAGTTVGAVSTPAVCAPVP